MVPTLIRIRRIQWRCSLYAEFNHAVHFFFRLKIPFLGKFGPKNQNYQFKLKFGIYFNSNIQNSMVMFTFCVFDGKYRFWANASKKAVNFTSKSKEQQLLLWLWSLLLLFSYQVSKRNQNDTSIRNSTQYSRLN